MKNILIVIILFAACFSLHAQNVNDSVCVSCNYDADCKEIVVNIRNQSDKTLRLYQYPFTDSQAGSQLIIYNARNGESATYGLCRFVDGKYQEPQVLHIIEANQEIKFQNKLERFRVGDRLSVVIKLFYVLNQMKGCTVYKKLEIQF